MANVCSYEVKRGLASKCQFHRLVFRLVSSSYKQGLSQTNLNRLSSSEPTAVCGAQNNVFLFKQFCCNNSTLGIKPYYKEAPLYYSFTLTHTHTQTHTQSPWQPPLLRWSGLLARLCDACLTCCWFGRLAWAPISMRKHQLLSGQPSQPSP